MLLKMLLVDGPWKTAKPILRSRNRPGALMLDVEEGGKKVFVRKIYAVRNLFGNDIPLPLRAKGNISFMENVHPLKCIQVYTNILIFFYCLTFDSCVRRTEDGK
jgi:hypothetical protein